MLFFPVGVIVQWVFWLVTGHTLRKKREFKRKTKRLFLWLDTELANNWKGFKIQRYNPLRWWKGVVLGGGGEWGQWDRASWHCQSSAWQKTCSQTIAGILNRRLQVSVLLSVSGRCAFDWWGFRRGALGADVSLVLFVSTCGLWINAVSSARWYPLTFPSSAQRQPNSYCMECLHGTGG